MVKKSAHPKYYVEGEEVVSVTTVIGGNLGWSKYGLLAWTRKMALAGTDPNTIKNDAASVGTLTHKMAENHILGESTNLFIYTEDEVARAKIGYQAFLDWETKFKPIYLETEVRLTSPTYGYGGTVDLVVSLDGVTTIVDLKTSNYIYKEHTIQLAAYKHLYEENTGGVKHCAILKLDKSGKGFEYHPISDDKLDAGFEAFKLCLILNKLKKQI